MLHRKFPTKKRIYVKNGNNNKMKLMNSYLDKGEKMQKDKGKQEHVNQKNSYKKEEEKMQRGKGQLD